MTLTCLLVAAVAFAPVARAVCAIQHIAVSVDVSNAVDDHGDQGSQTDACDSCCDEGSVAMTAEDGRSADVGVAQFTVVYVALAVIGLVALPSARTHTLAGRHHVPPIEPVLRRLPKLLI